MLLVALPKVLVLLVLLLERVLIGGLLALEEVLLQLLLKGGALVSCSSNSCNHWIGGLLRQHGS